MTRIAAPLRQHLADSALIVIVKKPYRVRQHVIARIPNNSGISMAEYYCHHCAIASSLARPINSSSLTGTLYKADKFIKHTAPSASAVYPINSVFNDSTYQTYERYVVNAAASGFLEIDDQGRKNIIWFAGSQIGVEYQNGVFVAPTDGVKLVLPEDDSKLHAFSISSSPLQSRSCALCGKSIPFW